MAAVTIPSFAVDAIKGTSFGSTASPVQLPGTPAGDVSVRIANLGPCHIAVKLGTDSTVTVTSSTGIVILAGEAMYLTLGSDTWIAGVSCGGPSSSSIVNLATGS